MFYECVGKCSHLFIVSVREFVGAEMYGFRNKNRVIAGNIFIPQITYETDGIRICYINVMPVKHILRHSFAETCAVRRCIDFGDDFHAVFKHTLLILAVLRFRIMLIGRQARNIAFKTKIADAVRAGVIDMQMYFIELEPREILCYFFNVFKRYICSCDINHTGAYRV